MAVIDIVDRKGDNWVKDPTKRLKPKFWLKCRDLKFKSSETKAEQLSRYKFTVYLAARLK